MGALTGLLVYAIFLAVGFSLLFVVVRAAVLSALRKHALEQRQSAAPHAQAFDSDAQTSNPE